MKIKFRVGAFLLLLAASLVHAATPLPLARNKALPAKPALKATPVSLFQINLSWRDKSANEDGFQIERSTDRTHFTQIAQLPPDTTSYRDTGLFPGTKYFYRVRAFNAAGNSDYSIDVARTRAPQKPLTIVEWGYTNGAPTTSPGWVSVSAGGYHGLALKKDGTVTAWGDNLYGEATPPTNLTGVVAIAAGETHSLALKNDGTVIGWGYNGNGEATPPTNLTGVIAISAGDRHNLALKGDGTVVGWGYNGEGETTPPANLSNVVAIAAGQAHSLALKSDGTVVAWGDNSFGAVTPPTNLTSVVAIAAALGFSLALKSDGTVVGWGYDGYGAATGATNVIGATAIAAGWIHSLARKNDGTVTEWGYDGNNLTPPDLDGGVVAISAHVYHDVALTISPAAPSDAKATVLSAKQIRVSWRDNSTDEKGFKIERATQNDSGPLTWTQIGAVGARKTNYTDKTVAENITYLYRVRAYDRFGASPYCAPITVIIAPLAAPQGVNPTLSVSDPVDLSWFDVFSGVDGFKIERAPDANGTPGAWAEIASVTATNIGQNGFTDSTALSNHIYWYRVRAFNVVGLSPYSDPVSIEVAPPPIPNFFSLMPFADTVSLSWSGNLQNEGFKIERAPDVGGSPGTFAEIANLSPGTESYMNVGLSLGATYWYRIRAYNWTGESPYSESISVTIVPPAAPSSLVAIIGATNSVVLSWNQNPNDEDGFKVERAPDVGGSPGAWNEIASLADTNASAPLFVDTNVIAYNTYWYRIRAFNVLGFSDYNAPINISAVPPLAPTALTATPVVDRVNLVWSFASVGPVGLLQYNGFNVERAEDVNGGPGNWTQIATVAPDNYAYTDSNRAAGTTYWYRVRAFNWIGNSPYSSLAAVTIVPPGTPLPPIASLAGTNQITLLLNEPLPGWDGFLVERAVDTTNSLGIWTQIAVVNSGSINNLPYTDTNVIAYTTNWYRVRAFSTVGVSDYSSAISIAAVPPPPPMYLGAYSVSDSAYLSWYDFNLPTDGTLGYKIERALVVDNNPGAWTQVGTAPGADYSNFYTDMGLAVDATYWYRARAFNWVGDSDYSDITETTITPPTAPSAPSAAIGTTNQINLFWNDSFEDEDGFTIERAPDIDGSPGVWTEIGGINATNYSDASFIDTNAVAYTTNWYRIRAFSASGFSEYSTATSVTIGPPAAPILSGDTFVNQAELFWDDSSPIPANVIGSRLERAPDVGGSPGTWVEIINTPHPDFTDTNLAANVTYWYRVRSYNWIGESPFSDPLSLTITPPTTPNNLTAALGTTNQVNLTWNDYATDEDGFKIERAPDANGVPGEWTEIGTVNTTNSYYTTFVDTNAMANTTNWYRVRAFSIVGISDYSIAASISIVPPPAPSNLSATPFKDTIQLYWYESYAGEINQFSIERAPDVGGNPGAWTSIATNLGFVNFYTDLNRTPNATYWYRVRAANWVGDSAPSSPVSVTVVPPAIPYLPYGYLGTTNQVILTCYNGGGDADGFRIERAPDLGGYPGTWMEIGTTNAIPYSTTLFTDTNALANTTNWYRVRAFNIVGTSDYSSPANVAVIPPGTPTGLFAAVFSAHQINLSWYDGSGLIQGYKIERAPDVDGTPGPWTQIADSPDVNAYSYYSDMTAILTNKYWYRVHAYNWVGNSDYSDPFLVNSTVPSAPSLTAVNDQPNQVTLSWTQIDADVSTGFRLERAPDVDGVPGTWIEIASPDSFSAGYEDTRLATGLTYWYRLRRYNSVGNSPYSNEVRVSLRDGTFVRVMQWNLERTLGRLENNSSYQAQAAAHIVNYNQPDVLLLCEVDTQNLTPEQNQAALIDWVTNNVPYLGTTFYVAVSSKSDGFIRNAAISRYPILGETTYDDGLRGLHAFQVKISDANALQIFHTHLKCCADDCSRKQAEAEFDTNIIAAFAATNSLPYIFAGDWNEEEEAQAPVCSLSDAYHPISTIRAGAALGDFKPTNLSGDYRTWSSQEFSPSIRFDYILPATNRLTPISGYVFSTMDWLNHGINGNFDYYDSYYASDHYSVFANYFFPAPRLLVTPVNNLTSAGYRGGPFSPTTQNYTLSNSTAGPLDWTVSESATWLTLSATNGTLSAGATASVTVSINTNANLLANGAYADIVVFSNATDRLIAATRPASVTVNDPASLIVSPVVTLNSLGTIGGPFNPNLQTYALSNAGIQTIDWQAGHLANWVTLSQSSGSLAPGESTSLLVSINTNAITLAAGDYVDTISITNLTSDAGDTTRTVDLEITSFGFFDDFSTFTAGNLVGQHSWAQALAPSTLPQQIQAGRLVIPRPQTGDNQDTYKNFTATNGTVFYGMTLVISNAPVSSSPSYFAALYSGNSASGFAGYRLTARDNGGGTCVLGARITGQAGNPYTFGTTGLAYGTEYRVIVEADSGGMLMRVFVDPTSADLSSQTPYLSNDIGGGSPPAQNSSFVFSQFNSSGSPIVGLAVGKIVVIDDFAIAYYDLTVPIAPSFVYNGASPALTITVTPPEILALIPSNNDVRITWSTIGGSTDIVQAAGDIGGNFSNISPALIIAGTETTTTNYLDAGALTNTPSRFYRIRRSP